MGNLIYLTLEGNIQGQISAGCSSQASVGNRHQLGHENAIFVFSLTQAASGKRLTEWHPPPRPAFLQTSG